MDDDGSRRPPSSDAVSSTPKAAVLGFSATQILQRLVATSAVLTVTGVIAVWYERHTGRAHWISDQLDLDHEANLTTWLAVALLLCASLLSFHLRSVHRRFSLSWARGWAVIGIAMMMASVDELAQIHEVVNGKAKSVLHSGSSGALASAWVVPFGAAALLFGVALWRFWLWLPAPTSRLLIGSAAVYFGGALGLEVVEGLIGYESTGWGLDITMVLQECLEMMGVSLFIYALLAYLEREIPTLISEVRPVSPASGMGPL